jgi:hypothetical protein
MEDVGRVGKCITVVLRGEQNVDLIASRIIVAVNFLF